ncbi:hydantoinase/oxoprolinase family protein [Sinorhizobium meliloti]|uniref:hydantoinase/oxoprolinase N-terminal domain-containing protein n=1 Tax=Rhizobium meliloti TaxID=382 RepID=UPI000FD89B34|nr:hydantoinase/oxoprolinase family protein [Sinorhizobium meliloti]TWA88232.1 N-methylhydantoinase A/oxoprolinase/acetone carboxylase beta subunit [Ensifer sp. SEMIA 134]TWB23819.1 N-methylhydantoinase A/oxoprolinase/acetone carboxylase beta subunit [Ensifer sp. SEMIA 135]RVG04803.1 hydantoinase/oxoprolinase family protein [Sinorhizobium meliloti]RVL19778.1 hydantoinase/oxoprolinase family protein [Sinorhizobium meliloti]RVP95558.1 hydantoinase/oxoprolinase family protein [Sinorhizobium melil
MTPHLFLGIDTGGTYTDAVLFSEATGVVAKAKALTTRHDLAEGVSGAVETVLAKARVPVSAISLVSLSTTLATNALVEGQGGRAGLIMIGFGPEDLKRDGLQEALGSDPVLFLPGGHNVHGGETPLDMSALDETLPDLSSQVSSFAIAGYFAVRNPDHEKRVRDRIREVSHLPVTCSHELSSKLGGPRRALTTLLNARLVSMIDRLIGSCEDFLKARGIDVPMMVVRGDGALISAAEARLRPIETILSGPAASLVGARYLTGLDNAIVSDIGGTTTDVAVLEKGRPRLDAEGAVVGGFRTMVEAVAMRTYGLGGDSEVKINDRGLKARLDLGPRRFLPLSLAAALHGDAVLSVLEKQLRAPHAGRHDGRLAVRTGLPDHLASGLQPQEQALYGRIGMAPVALADLLVSTPQKATLDRLVARGLVHICGLTPSDAMHVLGRQAQWNGEAARLGLEIAARTKDGSGQPIAASVEALAQMIVDRLTRQSSEAILQACLSEDSAAIDPTASLAVDRALKREPGIVRFSISLDRPLVGLGASAPVYYPAIAEMLSTEAAIPEEADVANAVGAVVGQVRATVTVFVTTPEEGIFIVNGAGASERFVDQQEAFGVARRRAETMALESARANGAEEPAAVLREEIDAPEVEGSRKLIEARFIASASGRPRIAHHAF